MRRAAAPGADGVTWADYRHGMRTPTRDLSEQLRAGTWTPGPVRMVDITSYTGKVFTAAIPTVEDRIVHRAMRRALDPSSTTASCGTGCRPTGPAATGSPRCARPTRHLSAGQRWVADIDVAGASAGGTAEQFVDWLAEHVTRRHVPCGVPPSGRGPAQPADPGQRAVAGAVPPATVPGRRQLDGSADRAVRRQLPALHPEPRRGRARRSRPSRRRWRQSGCDRIPARARIRPPHLANTEDLFLIDG